MKAHRQEVRDVLELLSYITLTRRYDPDGLDLYFTTDSKKLRPKTTVEVLKLFDERQAFGLPDMRERFASIIEKYQDHFGKKNFISKLLRPMSTPSKGPRRLTLYVLTDGVWQPECNLKPDISNLVDLLQKNNFPNKHVGIQFILFGDNSAGKKRLKTLDAHLGLKLWVTLPSTSSIVPVLSHAVISTNK